MLYEVITLWADGTTKTGRVVERDFERDVALLRELLSEALGPEHEAYAAFLRELRPRA